MFGRASKQAYSRDGLHAYCNPCCAAYMRERRAKWSPAKRKQEDLKARCRSYGITVAEFDSMYAVLPGCGICKEPKDKYDLKIDHCHSTGRVRGLLCNHCNSAIGLLKDNHMNMKSAIDYIGAVL